MMVDWHCHPSRDDFVQAVASEVAAIAAGAIEARGAALLALPGGNTPRPVFERLVNASLPWAQVTIIPTDDRLVDPSHELSNYRMLSGCFAPAGALVLPLASAGQDHHNAGRKADGRLRQLAWPPDLVWLGMGEDGHTASIFVGPDLTAALNAPHGTRATAVLPDPLPAEAPVARVTLTSAAILATRALLVTITGSKKKRLLETALVEGRASDLPIGRVLAGAEQPIHVHWCG